MNEEPEAASENEVLSKKTPHDIIAEFGYHFDERQLRKIKDGSGFTFTTQKDYEDLGDAIGEAIYDMMEKECGLVRMPCLTERNKYYGFVFTSPEYEMKETVLVLIHGSGVVKAGQWARKLIINENLDRGTQLPYIKRALANDWGVVVLNYNEKCDRTRDDVKHQCSPSLHGVAQFNLALSGDAPLFVVAHSFGGSIISDVMRRDESWRRRIRAVCLTDSWFNVPSYNCAANWCTSKQRLRKDSQVYQLYAGDDTHEGTSSAAINSIFHLLESHPTSRNFRKLLLECEEIVQKEKEEREKVKAEKPKQEEEKKTNGKEGNTQKSDFSDEDQPVEETEISDSVGRDPDEKEDCK